MNGLFEKSLDLALPSPGELFVQNEKVTRDIQALRCALSEAKKMRASKDPSNLPPMLERLQTFRNTNTTAFSQLVNMAAQNTGDVTQSGMAISPIQTKEDVDLVQHDTISWSSDSFSDVSSFNTTEKEYLDAHANTSRTAKSCPYGECNVLVESNDVVDGQKVNLMLAVLQSREKLLQKYDQRFSPSSYCPVDIDDADDQDSTDDQDSVESFLNVRLETSPFLDFSPSSKKFKEWERTKLEHRFNVTQRSETKLLSPVKQLFQTLENRNSELKHISMNPVRVVYDDSPPREKERETTLSKQAHNVEISN